MDVIIICNGLGNQMSQYAFYLQKRKLGGNTIFILDKNSKKDHNGYELDYVFNIAYKATFIKELLHLIFRVLHAKKYPTVSKTIIKILNLIGFTLVKEPENYDYNKDYMKASKGVRFFYGGWHSEKYFNSIGLEIKEKFKFKKADDHTLENWIRDIESLNNSVSIHIRRGDYMNEVNYKTFGSVCTIAYYKQAIEKIKATVVNPIFFIFSNDITWVKENELFNDMTIIDSFKGKDSWKDMLLISKCKHQINSNSTFGWWGAWLNANEEKQVIVPYYFINYTITKDLYPNEWIKVKL